MADLIKTLEWERLTLSLIQKKLQETHNKVQDMHCINDTSSVENKKETLEQIEKAIDGIQTALKNIGSIDCLYMTKEGKCYL